MNDQPLSIMHSATEVAQLLGVSMSFRDAFARRESVCFAGIAT